MVGMKKAKIAISLPASLVLQVRKAVRTGRASNVSAYVAKALEEKTKLDQLAELLDVMLMESGGPLSPAERKAADLALGVSKKRDRRKPDNKKPENKKRAAA